MYDEIMSEEQDKNVLIDINEIKEKEEKFYSEPFFYSYSSINKLLWSPMSFYQTYVLGIREERLESHLVNGRLIHLLLLEPEKFDEQFLLSNVKIPTGTTRLVIDTVFRHYVELKQNLGKGEVLREELIEYTDAILDVMHDLNYYQKLSTDLQRVEKVVTDEAMSYWNFLKKKEGKVIIDQETYDYCKTAVEIMKLQEDVIKLLGIGVSDFDNVKVFNELKVSFEFSNGYGFKGVIDNLVIDHDKKVVRINDIKTTSKSLKDFPETVDYYGYWMQAVIYSILATKMCTEEFSKGYNIEFNFIVLDKQLQVYAFPVKPQTLNAWTDKFGGVIEKVLWHYNNKKYDLPYEFANKLVSL